jgi:PncC family amidohydrolase
MGKYNEEDIRRHYHTLTGRLIRKGLTITTMESLTSGQVASLITDTEGASSVLKGAFITYSNEAKILQGVPAGIIDRYTVYSAETAAAMAAACMDAYHSDLSVGITGTAGNADPSNPGASVPGIVYFAVCIRHNGHDERETCTFRVELEPQPSRLMYKLAVAEEVFQAVTDILDREDNTKKTEIVCKETDPASQAIPEGRDKTNETGIVPV